MKTSRFILSLALLAAGPLRAQDEHHSHGVPEHLGIVQFNAGCAVTVAPMLDRAVALLHSFAYDDADAGFADAAARDPDCAVAHWGRAMTHYHQLWDVPAGSGLAAGIAEVGKAADLRTASPRDSALIQALAVYYAQADQVPAITRALRYSDAMASVAHDFPADDEVATFYALSLIATASPADHGHQRQKQAAAILETIWKRQPDHPGVPHYLIHAYDSAELALQGLPAARAYARIAPSAPHALHMPSHIFTRLGLWDDSIASNIAARDAARVQGDIGEQLHAMDYLTYAYLQLGRYAEAAQEVAMLHAMGSLSGAGFKIGYAANAMPVRLAVETQDWTAASALDPIPNSSPQVAALVWWARALGRLRAPKPSAADADIAQLAACRDALLAAHDAYWSLQTDALLKSAQAWQSATLGDTTAAIAIMSAAADGQDSLEKLPLTPGPIVPAREQLGELLLLAGKPREALAAFDSALAAAPGRRGALRGQAQAESLVSHGKSRSSKISSIGIQKPPAQ